MWCYVKYDMMTDKNQPVMFERMPLPGARTFGRVRYTEHAFRVKHFTLIHLYYCHVFCGLWGNINLIVFLSLLRPLILGGFAL